MIYTKEEMFLAEMGVNAQATIEGDYTATYKLKDLLKEYAEQCNIADVVGRSEQLPQKSDYCVSISTESCKYKGVCKICSCGLLT